MFNKHAAVCLRRLQATATLQREIKQPGRSSPIAQTLLCITFVPLPKASHVANPRSRSEKWTPSLHERGGKKARERVLSNLWSRIVCNLPYLAF